MTVILCIYFKYKGIDSEGLFNMTNEMRNTSSNAKAINEGIKALIYRPEEVMAFQGETITKFIPKKGQMEEDKFIVTTKTKHKISGKYDIVVPNARKDITYPGALLIGNEKLVNGVPDPLVLHRRPMTITIDLPGLTENNHILVERNDFAGITRGINILINNWCYLIKECYVIGFARIKPMDML